MMSRLPQNPDATIPDQRTSGHTLLHGVAASSWQAFLLIFLLAFGIRAVMLVFTPLDLVLNPGGEVRTIARSLATTGRFADPFSLPTGATAHLPPLYAGFVGLLHRFLGMTAAAGYVRCLLIIASYSVMYAMIPWLAGRFGASRQAGVLGGIVGALTPGWPGEVALAWEEPYAAIALGLLLVAFLRRWNMRRPSAAGSLLLGLAAGAVFHLSPNLLPVVLACVAFELWWSPNRRKWMLSALTILGILLACVPWAWRNYAELGKILFVRSNFGLELSLANHDGASPDVDLTLEREGSLFRHPLGNIEEAQRVRTLGEIAYMQDREREAVDWIRHHPAAFASLTARRAFYFWFGPLHRPIVALGMSLLTILAVLGARRVLPTLTIPQRAALLIPLATYPLVYYVLSYTVRYRVPMNWILLLLAGAELSRWIRRPQSLGVGGGKHVVT